MLLAHVITTSNQPENLTTSALEYVVASENGLAALRAFLATHFSWSGELCHVGAQRRFITECQPDLFGQDVGGKTIFLGEIKIWADLTPKQPTEYLDLLEPGGLLLFIVPEVRRAKIRSEVLRKLTGSADSDGTNTIEIGGKRLDIVSGLQLVKALLESAQLKTSEAIYNDLLELQAVWEEYDHMVPELPSIPKEKLNDKEWANLALALPTLPKKIFKRLQTTVGAKPWDRDGVGINYAYTSVEMGKLRGWIVYSPENWTSFGKSPVWFETNKNQYRKDLALWQKVRKGFSRIASAPNNQGPCEARTAQLEGQRWKAIGIPLIIKPDSPEVDVIDHIIEQLKEAIREIETV